VAGGDPVEVEIRSTDHGPIITSADVTDSVAIPLLEETGQVAGVPAGSPPRGDGYAVALRWTGAVPGRSAEGVLALNTASDWDEFTDAIELVNAFVQNIVYADAEGNVGYYVFGDIPTRRGYDGSLPVPGWDDRFDWTGTIPFEAKPHVFNPQRGYLATANETVVPPQYPYLITADAQFAFRGDRIRDALDADDAVSVDDAATLQMDSASWLAERLVPSLVAVEDLDEATVEAQALLADWDLRQEVDSAAAAYHNAVYAELLARTFRDELPEEAWPTGNGRWFVITADLLARPDDPYWDDTTTDDVVEDRDTILAAAMTAARETLAERLGDDPTGWTWGSLHTLDLVDPAFGTSGIAPVEWLFNRTGYPTGGGGGIVLANSWNAAEDSFSLTNVPTFRMVVDFGDLDASRWVNQSGQSGHPGHPHYDDQIAAWQSGDSPLMPWTDEAVEAATVHRLALVPDDSAGG
jgi:penicillin amidase